MLSSSLLTASQKHEDRKLSQSEQAYQLLKEKIVTLELSPATLINEAELMEKFELGRTPLREALQRLARESLVIILPRRGTIVADLNLSDLQKIFEVRLDLEVFAVRLAAKRATPEELTKMAALLADIRQINQEQDPDKLFKLDQQAHEMIAQAARNEFLAQTLSWLYTHMLRLWHVSIHRVEGLRRGLDEHRQIVAALQAGDVEQATAMMKQHITHFQERNFNELL